jgi:hypothetical protein
MKPVKVTDQDCLEVRTSGGFLFASPLKEQKTGDKSLVTLSLSLLNVNGNNSTYPFLFWGYW